MKKRGKKDKMNALAQTMAKKSKMSLLQVWLDPGPQQREGGWSQRPRAQPSVSSQPGTHRAFIW